MKNIRVLSIFVFLFIGTRLLSGCECGFEKIIYSHVGHSDKPIWTMQLSYLSFDDNYSEGNEFYWKGLSSKDSMQSVICVQIEYNTFFDLANKITDSGFRIYNTLCSRQYGNFCVTIIQNNCIHEYFLSRDEFLESVNEQLIILNKDKNAERAVNYLNNLKKRLSYNY